MSTLRYLLLALILVILVIPALAGTGTITIPIPINGSLSYTGAPWAYVMYDPTLSGEPVSYTILEGGAAVNWGYWVYFAHFKGDHNCIFNLSYNNHNYSTVYLTVTDNGYDPLFNDTTFVGRSLRLDYTFTNIDPAITSFTGPVMFTALEIKNNLTYYPGTANLMSYNFYSNINNSVNITNGIGMAFQSTSPAGTLITKDRTYSFTYTGGPTPTPTPTATAPSLSGYTNNAYTNQTIQSVVIRSDQSSSVVINNSQASGYYHLPGLVNGELATITATKTGYTQASGPFTFTPMNDTQYIGNISMIPDYIPNATAIFGIVYEDWSHNPLSGATVTLENATWSDTYTTSGTGFYMFDWLPAGSVYTASATKTGYDNSADYSVTTVSGAATQQDIPLTANYDLIVEIKDASSGAFLVGNEVFIQLSDGQHANTTFGLSTFTVGGGLLTITATTSGYAVAQQQVGISSDTTATLLMYNTTTGTGAGINYPPHQVKFILRNQWGNPLENVAVTAQGYETTGEWEWLSSLLGLALGTNPIHNASMNGNTAEDGSIVFMMLESVKYQMTFINSTQGVYENYTVYPKDDYYEIWVTTGEGWFNTGYNALEEINISVSKVRKNTTHGFINITYKDALLGTTGGTIYVNQTNKTGVNLPDITVASYAIPSSNFNKSFTVSADDDSYFVVFGITHSTFGTVIRTFAVIFEKIQVGIGLPSSWLIYIAVFFILFTGMFFGAVTSPTIGAVVTCFVGWIMWGLGWLADMGSAAPMALIFATFIAILSVIMVRSRKERYL